jgi:hypothetical protein
MRLEHFVSDDNQKGLGITFIDIDETLFNTFAKIKVVKDGEIIKSLSNTEFNAYRAKEGESFDYSDFRSSRLFYDTSKPIEKMVKRAVRIIKRTEVKGSRVIILTARADMDDRDLFLSKFRKTGIPIDSVYIERAGNKNSSSVSSAKKSIIINYLKSGLYRRVRIFDDYMSTCKKFLTIKNDLPKETLINIRDRYGIGMDVPDNELIHFEAWHVKEDGSIEEIK